MPIEKLSVSQINKLNKNGMYGDGGNLWLCVSGNGEGKSWLFRWTERGTGRERNMGLGPLHTIDLSYARELAKANRLLLLQGKDPKAERDGQMLDHQIARGLAKTVNQVIDEYYEAKLARKSLGYRKAANLQINNYIRSTIGDMPIQKVSRDAILNKTGLKTLWTTKHPTGNLVRMHLLRNFKHAMVCGYIKENPADPEFLKNVLPSSGDVHQAEHHPGPPYTDIYRFLEHLRAVRVERRPRYAKNYKYWNGRPMKSLIVEFAYLTGVRHGEIRFAQWKEFDFKTVTWNVPSEHRKTGKPGGKVRPVPITKLMVDVLNEARSKTTDHSPDAIAFPDPNGRRIGGSSLALYIERTNWPTKTTVHGARSTLRDWQRAKGFPDVLWDIQVDHKLGDKTSQAYGHDTLLEQRREMMTKWDEHCSRPPEGAEVIKIAERRR